MNPLARWLGYREYPEDDRAGWWEAWEHNFGLSLKILLTVLLTAVIAFIAGAVIAQILNG